MNRPAVTSVTSVAFAALVTSCAALLACGAPPPKAADPVPLAVGAGDRGAATAAPSGSTSTGARRGASDALKQAWPLDEPSFVLFADLAALARTELVTSLVADRGGPAAMMTAPQRTCVDAVLAHAQELAVGSDASGGLAVVRFEASAMPLVASCITTVGDGAPITLPGASAAWSVKKDVAAMTPKGLLVLGSRPLVERALAGRGSVAALATVTLGSGELVAWTAQVFDGEPPMHGTLLATSDRFRLAGEIDLPSEELARRVEQEMGKRELLAKVPGTGLGPEQVQSMSRLAGAVGVKRSGRHLALAFDLREPAADQARDLGVAATLAIYGVRRYLSNAKLAEARNTLGVLGRDLVATWEQEDGKPRAKKKLASYPPVPRTVPRGVKYQSSSADWKAWAPLHFEMTAPQYFQYEIKAAKDGESAEIIARGDLNGDGKTSELKLLVKVERPSNVLVTAPAIHETDADE